MYEVINISKSYGEKLVLNNISFNTSKGEIVSIVGKNGSGKTTLLKIMICLINASSGKILFQNKNIHDYNQSIYKYLGVVLEDSRNVYYYMSLMDNIYYFSSLMGLSSKYIKKNAKDLLDFFNLYDVRNKNVGTFSRGMIQKVSLLLSMIHKPDVLFLDEPTLGLDILSKEELILKLKNIAKNNNTTIILTSHQSDVIENMSDRLFYLKNGNIDIFNSVSDFQNKFNNFKYVIRFKGAVPKSIDKRFNLIDEGGIVSLSTSENDITFLNNELSRLIKNGYQIIYFGQYLNSMEKSILASLK